MIVNSSIESIVREHGNDRSRLMDVALAVQRQDGFVSDDAVHEMAAALSMQPVEVEDTVSFYSFLNRKPLGRFHIRVSKTPVSLMKGAAEVMRALIAAVSENQAEFTVEWTSDIGMADQEPSALINQTVVTNLTPEVVPSLVAALRTHGDPAQLPEAKVRSSLVQPGPIIFSPNRNAGDGVKAALALSPEAVIKEISKSKLRGRGGAGFPTALKWRLCRESMGDGHHVVCNADEGEPGTFKDRVLLTHTPDLVFDGMTIAAYALGARHGLVYLRGEYEYLLASLQQVLEKRRQLGLLGFD